MSNARVFVETLPSREIPNSIANSPPEYQTVVGKGGSRLSGGQRQRIAIARALLRCPKILVLDEATSALDNNSERIVQGNIMKVARLHKCTVVIIAHRLSTIRSVDRIFVFQAHRALARSECYSYIAEQGTHDSLLNQKGIYASMYNLQCGGDRMTRLDAQGISNPEETEFEETQFKETTQFESAAVSHSPSPSHEFTPHNDRFAGFIHPKASPDGFVPRRVGVLVDNDPYSPQICRNRGSTIENPEVVDNKAYHGLAKPKNTRGASMCVRDLDTRHVVDLTRNKSATKTQRKDSLINSSAEFNDDEQYYEDVISNDDIRLPIIKDDIIKDDEESFNAVVETPMSRFHSGHLPLLLDTIRLDSPETDDLSRNILPRKVNLNASPTPPNFVKDTFHGRLFTKKSPSLLKPRDVSGVYNTFKGWSDRSPASKRRAWLYLDWRVTMGGLVAAAANG